MLKKSFEFSLLTVCIFLLSAFSASAECEHNFTGKLIYNDDFSHSYECLKECGSCGTVSGGEGATEKCSLKLLSKENATCTREGEAVYMCTVCYRNKCEIIPVIKHSYIRSRRLPTCTQQGYDFYKCSLCGDSYSDNFVNKLSHLSDGGTVEALPSYGKAGSFKVSCRVCGCLLERKILPELVEIKNVAKVTGFKVKACSDASVTLKWNKSANAVTYKVLYSTDKRKWKSLYTEKTSVTVKGLASAKKYYFKICAAGDGSVSDYSSIISACTKPKGATLDKISAGKASATLKWKKLSGVSGYEISYTADSFDKKKTVKTVTVIKDVKKTVKKLKKGKKYYFRIRAYKCFGSEKIYGAYSKVKTVKIK